MSTSWSISVTFETYICLSKTTLFLRFHYIKYQVCKYETGNLPIDGHSCQCSCRQTALLMPFPCSHKDFQLTTIQVSYNSIVCNSVEHVEFCAWKLICGQHWFSVTIWRKLLQNRIECLSKLTMSMLMINHSALSNLKNSKVAIWREKRRKPSKKFKKIMNCKHCWMRMTLKLNNSRINWMRHEKPSPYVWNP